MDSNGNGSGNCLPPNALLGEYRLLEVIGEGGFGIVYRAHDLSLDREVAIKEYLPATMASRSGSPSIHVRSQHRGAFDAGLRSFINEARLLAKFSHPALVQVHRFFEGNGTAYMVMRCYEGQTLRTYLENSNKAVDERWLKAILCPLLDVLEMLHAADCYHRDIAPDNVFLQNTGSPVMLDFGAARRIISDMTQALTMVLKPGFAPIEQYAEDGSMPQGAWTDVYQLGALIYQAITGKPPTTSVARMINDPIKPLSPEKYPAFSEEFLQGLHKALAVKPQDRPQSIPELRDLLGITDFSSSAFARLSMVTGPRELSAAGRTASEGGPPLLSAFPVTTPSSSRPPQTEPSPATAQSVAAETAGANGLPKTTAQMGAPVAMTGSPDLFRRPAEASSDELLSLFDKATTPPEERTEQRAEANPTQAAPVPERATPASTTLMPRRAPNRPSKKIWVAAVVTGGIALSAVLYQLQSPNWTTQSNAEDELWLSVKTNPNAAAYREYLKAYPEGAHSAEAKAGLTALEKPTPADVAVNVPPVQPEVSTQIASSSVDSSQATPPPQKANTAPQEPSPKQPESRPSPTPLAGPSAPAVAPTPPVEPVARGKVIFRVTPWGRIYVDRVGIGLTPPRMELDLPVGTHRVSVTNPAAPPMVWTVNVNKDEPVVLTHHFENKAAGEQTSSSSSENK